MCLILCGTFSIGIYRHRLSSLKTGFLLYAEPASPEIVIYDIQTNEKSNHPVSNYIEIFSIGPYYAGEFCCGGSSATSNETLEYSISLFQKEKCEQTLSVPYKPVQVAALEDTIYFSHESTIYVVDRATSQSKPIVENVHIDRRDNVFNDGFFLNENGDLAFLRDSVQGLQLWCLCAGKEVCMGEVNSVFGWVSNDSIMVLAEDEKKHERVYIIQKDTSRDRQISLLRRFGSAAIFPREEKMACWFPTNEPNWYQYGIVDLKTGWVDRYAFGDQLDSCMTLPKYVLWVEEEPSI